MNDWNTSYSTISFVERTLGSRDNLIHVSRESDIVFNIARDDGEVIIALVVGRYTISLNDVIRAKSEFPQITCIVGEGNWSGYTEEAKEYGSSIGVGVFEMREFLGAINWKNVNSYHRKDRKGNPTYSYHSA